MIAQSRLKNTEAIQLYQVLVDRVKHEGNLYWVRFSAFFVMVSALTAAWARGAFGVRGASETDLSFLVDPTVRVVVLLAGSLIALAWLLANLNGAAWQEYFNHQISSLEKEYPFLRGTYTGFWRARLTQTDVVAIAILLSALSLVGWIFIAFFFDLFWGCVSLVSCAGFVILAVLTTNAVNHLTPIREGRAEGAPQLDC